MKHNLILLTVLLLAPLAALHAADAATPIAELDLGARVQPVPQDARFSDPGYFVWCGAPARGGDGKYHLFYSRWLVKDGFSPGWAIHSEIAYAVADQPLGPYKFVNVALPARGSNPATGEKYWDADVTHNPNIVVRDGRYLLYYTGNHGDGKYETHRNHQRIGVAVADKPEGPWRRFDQPIIDVSEDPSAFDALCIANPAAAVRPDGGLLVVYKGVCLEPGKVMGGKVRWGVAVAEKPEGPYIKKPGRVFEAAGEDAKKHWMLAEDPFIWFSKKYGNRYYAVANDIVGRFTGEAYTPGNTAGNTGLALFESADGLDWQPATHPKVLGKRFVWTDGKTSDWDIARPALLFEGEEPLALFGATDGWQKNRTATTPGCIAFNVQIPLRPVEHAVASLEKHPPLTAPLSAEALLPLEIGSVTVGGEMGRRIDATVANNLLVLDTEKNFLKPFQGDPEKRPGTYIGVGILIETCARVGAHGGDAGVKALKEKIVREIITTQEADGYIGNLPPANRIWKTWDIHEMSYLIHGLCADHRYFGEKPSLDAARKLADCLLRHWEARKPDLDRIAKENYGPAWIMGLETAMLALHQETRDPRYLEFVTGILKLADWNRPIVTDGMGTVATVGSFRNLGQVGSFLCRSVGQLRLYRLQPDERLLGPARRALDFMLRGDGMMLTGEVSVWECWHDTQEGTEKLGETCSTAYLVRWLDELLRLEGRSLYGDLMERIVLNGLFAAQSPDGRRTRMYTPMEGPREYFGSDTYCCPNNYRRIIAELPTFIFYRAGDGLTVNLYTASEAALDLKPGLTLRVKQETDYPSSGRVTLRVDPSQPAQFPIKLRIPRWCSQPAVSVNGQPLTEAVPSGEFFTIARDWRPGDRVELDLPMPLRLVKGRAAQAGRAAVMRGPQVFALSRTRHAELAGRDLRLLAIDPAALEGPAPDDSVRPGGMIARVKAWSCQKDGQVETDLKLELTEFADPAAEFTYFKVRQPNDPRFEDDELLSPVRR